MSLYAVDKLMSEARRIAAEYRQTTGKSLGISAEIAKHDACRLLDLEPSEEGGFDATGKGNELGHRYQIKGRAIFDESKSGQRLGQLKLEHEWDSVLLVLMNEAFDTYEIYQADRDEIIEALNPDSSRNKRGAMSIARFKAIAHLIWTTEDGRIKKDQVWDNQRS